MTLFTTVRGVLERCITAALATMVVLGSLAMPSATLADTPTPPPTASLTQSAVTLSATNLETVAVTGQFSGFVAPYHYVFAMHGTAAASGDDSVPSVTVNLVNNCSITTQSVSVTITDANNQTATANATLDHSLCPPPPTANHAADHVIAGPTITSASFVDRLRAVNSPAYSSGSAIYTELVGNGVNPSFALGVFQAESSSGTKGYAVTTLNWGNMLYHSWQATYGAVPYAPGNGYTYARFPSWIDGVRAYAYLVGMYDGSGYVTVSEASAHWLGSVEGSARHLTYLGNITKVMTLLPDDAVPKMTGLAAPAKAPASFVATWTATDNLGVVGYQVRTRLGSGAWSATQDLPTAAGTFALSSGAWTIGVRATDAAGNWSSWRQLAVNVDAGVPVVTHLSAPTIVRSVDRSFVASFAATDNIGVTGYLIRTRHGAAGAWSAVMSQTGRTRTFNRLSVGTWYVDVAARDAAGNISPWREVRVVVPTDDRMFHFSHGTTRVRARGDVKGTETTTNRPGATMTVTFSGTALYIVGTSGVSNGKFRVTIDGVSSIVDEGRFGSHRATSTHRGVLVFSASLAAGPHTLVITNLGTMGRPTISIDAIGWSD
jgi:hypothetical protein